MKLVVTGAKLSVDWQTTYDIYGDTPVFKNRFSRTFTWVLENRLKSNAH
jgi:hypothetical protein